MYRWTVAFTRTYTSARHISAPVSLGWRPSPDQPRCFSLTAKGSQNEAYTHQPRFGLTAYPRSKRHSLHPTRLLFSSDSREKRRAQIAEYTEHRNHKEVETVEEDVVDLQLERGTVQRYIWRSVYLPGEQMYSSLSHFQNKKIHLRVSRSVEIVCFRHLLRVLSSKWKGWSICEDFLSELVILFMRLRYVSTRDTVTIQWAQRVKHDMRVTINVIRAAINYKCHLFFFFLFPLFNLSHESWINAVICWRGWFLLTHLFSCLSAFAWRSHDVNTLKRTVS